MTRKGAKQFSVAFWQILEMQMGFHIGELSSKSKLQIQFAFPALHQMQIKVLVAEKILNAFWQIVQMQIGFDIGQQ